MGVINLLISDKISNRGAVFFVHYQPERMVFAVFINFDYSQPLF